MSSCRGQMYLVSHSLSSFFANLNQRASTDIKHAPFNRPLPRENFLPYSIGKVDGGFRKSVVSATDSLGKYSQITIGSASSTRSEGCAEEGRLSGRGSDRAQALPHSTAMYAIAEKYVEVLEVHRAGWGGNGIGGWTLEDQEYSMPEPELNEQTSVAKFLLVWLHLD